MAKRITCRTYEAFFSVRLNLSSERITDDDNGITCVITLVLCVLLKVVGVLVAVVAVR